MTEHRSPAARIVDRTVSGGRLSRHDLVLLVIPAAYLLGGLLGSLVGALRSGVAAGSLLAALAVADALFLNPPVGRGGDPGAREPGERGSDAGGNPGGI